MEESSPYARPVKHMNAVRRGLNSEEADLGDENLDPAHVASDRVQDQNLSVKQLFLRYSGIYSDVGVKFRIFNHLL